MALRRCTRKQLPVNVQHLPVPRTVEVESIAPRRPRRLVLVQGSHEEVETAIDEEGSVVSTSGEGVFETIREPDIEMPEVRDSSAAIREGFRHLDAENVSVLFETRANVLKTVPHFLKGPYRTATRIALTEASCGDEFRRVRGWKLFLVLPRVLLSRKPRGGLISREKLTSRFCLFSQGRWTELIRASEQDAEDASTARCRRLRRRCVDVESRAARAQILVQLGELSPGRQALEAAEVAPGTLQTLQALRDPSRRPRRAREPISRELLDFEPATSLELDEWLFSENLRSARRGAAAGPSGMTTDHLRPLLDNVRDLHLLFSVREHLATDMAPQEVVEIGRGGRLTALKKPNGRIRDIVSGEVVRRLVSRTIDEQVRKAVEAGTAPFQCALSTKAGSECVAHALQALCELDPSSTVVSVDGIGAFDLVSAMLQGLRRIAPHVVPFVRQFHGTPSTYWWEGDEGVTHHVHRAKEESRVTP